MATADISRIVARFNDSLGDCCMSALTAPLVYSLLSTFDRTLSISPSSSADGDAIRRRAIASRANLQRLGFRGAGIALAVLAAVAIWITVTHSTAPKFSSNAAVIHQQLRTRLLSRHLGFQYIACATRNRRYDGVRIVRCDVNFGDPHVVAYCSVLRNGILLTSLDGAPIRCRQ
jgi:hypothetical protein